MNFQRKPKGGVVSKRQPLFFTGKYKFDVFIVLPGLPGHVICENFLLMFQQAINNADCYFRVDRFVHKGRENKNTSGTASLPHSHSAIIAIIE